MWETALTIFVPLLFVKKGQKPGLTGQPGPRSITDAATLRCQIC